jgi:hypothetical protein
LQEKDMRKIRLRIDDLRVETFATSAREHGRGTVAAHQLTEDCFTPPCPASVEPCVTQDLACLTRHC